MLLPSYRCKSPAQRCACEPQAVTLEPWMLGAGLTLAVSTHHTSLLGTCLQPKADCASPLPSSEKRCSHSHHCRASG